MRSPPTGGGATANPYGVQAHRELLLDRPVERIGDCNAVRSAEHRPGTAAEPIRRRAAAAKLRGPALQLTESEPNVEVCERYSLATVVKSASGERGERRIVRFEGDPAL
jgi:hypothetical protein